MSFNLFNFEISNCFRIVKRKRAADKTDNGNWVRKVMTDDSYSNFQKIQIISDNLLRVTRSKIIFITKTTGDTTQMFFHNLDVFNSQYYSDLYTYPIINDKNNIVGTLGIGNSSNCTLPDSLEPILKALSQLLV